MTGRGAGLRGSLFVGVLLLGTVLASAGPVAGELLELPDAVARAVREAFPDAVVSGVDMENEEGVTIYVVRLDHGEVTVDVEVSVEGVIGEVETEMGIERVPGYMADAIREATGGGEIALIEKHEMWGRVRDGRLVKLDEPMVVYEVKFILDGRRRIVEVPDSPILKLSRPARAAIMAAFPAAIVKDVEAELELSLEIFEVELEQDGQKLEVEVTPDGIIVEVETSIESTQLPKAVAEAISEAAGGARILKLEKEEIRAVPKLVPLDEPRVIYEAKFVKDGKTYEIEIAADGTVIEIEEEEEHDGENE